jgi:uncharacterized membrane protein YjgN (DUF898 family)
LAAVALIWGRIDTLVLRSWCCALLKDAAQCGAHGFATQTGNGMLQLQATTGLEADAARPPHVSWVMTGGMVGLSVTNFVLKILTLGIYQFWGKTEVRQRIWSAVRLEGEPLVYTGTGRELFTGFVFVFAAVLIPALLYSLASAALFAPMSTGAAMAQAVLTCMFLFLFGVGVHRAQRYRMSRTRWRGIRGSVVGSPWRYARTYFWTTLLIPLTLGWIIPWRATRLQRLLVEDMRFGDKAFAFTENAGPLYGRFIALWLGAVIGTFVVIGGLAAIGMSNQIGRGARDIQLSPTGAIQLLVFLFLAYVIALFMSSWYRAGQFNVFARSTTFDGVAFRGSMTGTGLLWVTLSNLVLVIFSLGLFGPVAQSRSARYVVEHVGMDGHIPFEALGQSLTAAGEKGEGLAQAFDFDAF